MASKRFTSDVLRMFYGVIAEAENRNLPQALAEEPTLSESIKNLPRKNGGGSGPGPG